ncbi:heparin lyase I family protein [Maribacter sp. 2307ULW6-5]|uniref:heparin lyase I family protein n=1 Tax=Maribacter sp. 2307ULW6-5 TaxID=3386275 RepID=UPI0039BC53A1
MKPLLHSNLCFLVVLLLFGCSSKDVLGEDETGPNEQKKPFIESLTSEARASVLWHSNFEDRSFKSWEDEGTGHEYAGGGIFKTDNANSSLEITREMAHSGQYAALATIRNVGSPGAPKAVRLMRWTDLPWNKGGTYFPKEAYYSVFLYFPKAYDPKKPEDNNPLNDGGWWNIFQFKSDNNAGSQPMAVVDVYNEGGKMYLGLVVKTYANQDSDTHSLSYVVQQEPLPLPVGEWVHLEAFYKKATDASGALSLWQNGNPILEKKGFQTQFFEEGATVWGIGNYSDYIHGGKALVYMDDAIVSTSRIGAMMTPGEGQ